ncbi:MAG: glycosyltransferase, partial [Planctomycetota bacterium]
MLAYAAHWIVILIWLNCHRQINRARRSACRPSPAAKSAGESPFVTVVLPSRNEAENLEACAQRILAQRGVDLQLVIVDDRSTDATGEIARGLAATDHRIEVVRNDALQPGWMGKTYACALGASRARGDWLLFTDADVRLEPDALASAVAYAAAKRLDVFSLWPRDGSSGFWERLLVPLCGAMIVIWYGTVASESSPGGAAFANGQFLLVRRRAYEAFGGHAAVRSALIEDVALARAAARRGLRVGSALGADLVRVRMYAS